MSRLTVNQTQKDRAGSNGAVGDEITIYLRLISIRAIGNRIQEGLGDASLQQLTNGHLNIP